MQKRARYEDNNINGTPLENIQAMVTHENIRVSQISFKGQMETGLASLLSREQKEVKRE
jgi:hypothetical protein